MDILLFVLGVFGLYGLLTRILFLSRRLFLFLRISPASESLLWFWLIHLIFGWGLLAMFLVEALSGGGGPILWFYGLFLPVPGLLWLIIDQGLDLFRAKRALGGLAHKDRRVPALLADINALARDNDNHHSSRHSPRQTPR